MLVIFALIVGLASSFRLGNVRVVRSRRFPGFSDFQEHRSSMSLFMSTGEEICTPAKKASTSFAAPALAMKGLQSGMFAHPLDVQVTEQLSRIPIVQNFARRVFDLVEQAFVVENLASSVLVGPQQMPKLYQQLITASKVLDMDPPDLYVKQNPVPNAYTLAFQGRKPFIVVHTSLLDLLNEEEVLAVIGHEMGHLKCEHGVWVTVLNLLVEAVDLVSGMPSAALRSLLLRWQRSAEYSCDRAALLCTNDPKVVASVLMKLCGGSTKNEFSKELSVDAFLQQAKTLKTERKTRLGRIVTMSSEQVATHPIPLLRATELVKWHESPQYAGLLVRGRPIKSSTP